MLGIGFDTGGSRTTYSTDRGDGPQMESGNETSASLANARDNSSTQAAISWIIDVIHSQEDDEIVAWIGAAGFSAATSRAIEAQFAAPLRELSERLELEDRHCEVYIANDAISILKAPPLLGAGVVAIVGTGSVVLGAHPKCHAGVIKRGGWEWLVSDEGAGVWMTLQCIRLLLLDIQSRGSLDYRSVLLDRLADHLSITVEDTQHIPASHRAMAKAELIARRAAENRPDTKRFFASFVHPDIFDLAVLKTGLPHDPLAAQVLEESVRHIAEGADFVSTTLAAHTADEPNQRESLPMVVGGKIAANPHYDEMLRAAVGSTCRSVNAVETIGDAAERLATLAVHYLKANMRGKSAIMRSPDPLHSIVRLL
jgi:N-acetylglucosamine kinase-like BadF-type ATPase